MNMHSEAYKRIRKNIIETWPAWRRKIYNSCFAVSAHAEKLPEDNSSMLTNVRTNYDILVSSTPEEMAKIIRPWCPYEQTGCVHLMDKTDCGQCRLEWLKSPVEKGEEEKKMSVITQTCPDCGAEYAVFNVGRPLAKCPKCGSPFFVPKTNYDNLISKTPEEMADWLCKILTYCSNRHCNPDCPLFKCCHDQQTDNIEGWLKSPVEVGNEPDS